ncbi:MAG: class I SAM-dependent rRNA methyltransferase [Bacteroidetes bacterium]|nr:MAG: class I SAM-dependent rRNA methyltransferase [Bacteroidota bacterium]
MARIVLRTRKDKLIRQGYPWIFANLIDRVEGDPATGDVVQIAGTDGHVYGQGFYHADSLIAVRFLTSDPDRPIDDAFFRARLERAFRLRETVFGETTHYRLVYSESDGLPGTIVDRYGSVLTWTSVCAGMEQRRDGLLDLLEDLVGPRAIVERNDSWLREKDGLAESTGVLRGTCDAPVEIDEDGVRFAVDVLEGPKTGFFIDQRLHRQMVRRVAAGRRVLDVFCADGGFGLHAAAGGAASVHFLDVSGRALERVRHNAALNGVADRCSVEQANALDRLGDYVAEGRTYDLVVLDPPGFARQRREVDDATRAYQRINITGLQLLPPGGLLATASCSQAVSEEAFLKIIRYSARKAGARLRLLYRGGHPPDHPVLDAMPETAYLKFFLFEKLDDEAPGAGF